MERFYLVYNGALGINADVRYISQNLSDAESYLITDDSGDELTLVCYSVNVLDVVFIAENNP